MSKPDMGSIFHIKINEIFCSLETIMWIIKIIKIKCVYPFWILNEHWCIYSCLQISPIENWFQYVRRVCATPINFPCVPSSSVLCLYYTSSLYYLQLTRMYHLKLWKKWIWYTKAYSRGGAGGSAAPGPVKFMNSRGFSAPNGCPGQILITSQTVHYNF